MAIDLIEALKSDSTDSITSILKDPNLNVNAVNKYNESGLIIAVEQGDVDIVQQILNHPDIDLHIQSYINGTALTLAIYSEESPLTYDMTGMLLKKEIEKEGKFDTNLHPEAFNWAIRGGTVDLVKELINLGADVNAPGNQGLIDIPPWVEKEGFDSDEIALPLREIGDLPLILALREDKTDMARLLLQHGADANKPNYQGITAASVSTELGISLEILSGNLTPSLSAEEKGGTAISSANKTIVVYPGRDQRKQTQREYKDDALTPMAAPPAALIDNLAPAGADRTEYEEDLRLINRLLHILFSGQKFSSFKKNKKLPYQAIDFLNNNWPSKATKKITLRDLVEFHAHLTSHTADLAINIAADDIATYQQQGLLNEDSETTALFRQLPLYQAVMLGQRQWEGMRVDTALIQFYFFANKVAKSQGRSSDMAAALLPHLEKTLFLKQHEHDLTQNTDTAQAHYNQLALYLLTPKRDEKKSLLLQSGYYGHAFYLTIESEVINKATTQISILIHNYNGDARRLNQQEAGTRNDFKPYAFRFQVGRLNAKGRTKNRLIDFGPELSSLSAYLNLIQTALIRSRYFSRQSTQRPTRLESAKVMQLFKKLLGDDNGETFLTSIRTAVIDAAGYFSWPATAALLEQADWLQNLPCFTDHTIPANRTIQLYLLQYIQTWIFIDAIYHPDLYGAGQLQRDVAYEQQLPSYSLQRIGNCTVYNLKIALWHLAEFDWRTPECFERICRLNFDLDFAVIDSIKKIGGELATQLRNAKPFRMPGATHPGIPPLLASAKSALAAHCPEEAIAQYQAAIQLQEKTKNNPGHLYADLGAAFDLAGRKEEAIIAYNDALLLITDARINCNLAILYAEQGRHEQALVYYQEALQINPYAAQTYYQRANSFVLLGNNDAALADMKKATELEPDNASLLLRYSELLATTGQFELAFTKITAAYDLGLRSHEILTTAFKYNRLLFNNRHHQAQNKPLRFFEYRLQLRDFLDAMKENLTNMLRTDTTTAVAREENKRAVVHMGEAEAHFSNYNAAMQQQSEAVVATSQNSMQFWAHLHGIANPYQQFLAITKDDISKPSDSILDDHADSHDDARFWGIQQ